MARQQQNITTLLIPDPNGGQPQMIKVMGGKASSLPIQLAGMSGSTGRGQGMKATFIKTNPDQANRNNTMMHAGKLHSGLIAIPAKQNIRGGHQVVGVPVSSVHMKTNHHNTSPVVIRTQTGSLSANNQPTMQQGYQQQQIHQVSNNMATIQAFHTSSPQQQFTQPQQQQQQQQPQQQIIQQQQHRYHQQQQQHHQQQPQAQQQQQQQLSSGTPPKSLITTPILDHSGARKRHDFDFDYGVESKRRRSEKGGKGLRHFSMKVCEKVKAKGTTSYNEVADELVNEFTDSTRCSSPADGANYDQKNIRRRVYDALNVLMAMNIISKEKKEIRWLGLPTNSAQECHKLQGERNKMMDRIKIKTQQLQDLLLQQVAFKNLVERNRLEERTNGAPSPNSAIQLPFIIVNTSKKTVIDCSISNDKTEYLFNFDDTFEIHDDIEVLKRMGMALGLEKGECAPKDLEKIKKMIPKALESYVVDMSENVRGDVKSSTVEESIDGLEDMDIGGALSRTKLAEGSGSISRHSSFTSLHQEHRPESASPSSFGDEDEEMDESDVEIG